MSGARVPAMVTPKILEFDTFHKNKQKQTLTVMNTHNVPLHYKIRCTSKDAFSIQSAKGTLKPKSSFGVVVTLNPTAATDSGKVRFKFEISCWDDSRSVEGVTVATAYVNRSRGSITGAEGVRRGSVDGTTSNLDNVHESVHRYKAVDTRRTSPSVVLFTAAVLLLCLAVLFSPSEYECTAADQTSPVSVFPTVQPSHQMVAAFVLGMVTMTILQTHSRANELRP